MTSLAEQGGPGMGGHNVFQPYDFRGDLTAATFKRFIKYCADSGASDILIQGGDYVWVEIHGRQQQASTHTIKQGQLPALIGSIWQAEVESNVRGGKGADRSLELCGEEVGLERGKTIRFRCNFIQARIARIDEAYSITMRTIPTDLPDIAAMGIEPDLFDALYPGMGLVLVCGPTGSGKTTFQAAVYAHAGRVMPDRKVITYEDPIEFVLGGTHWCGPQPAQSQIGRDIQNFALGLRNAMRRKPSIIGIGEARDLETVDAMIEAGLTGHLCYATVHTESVAETINRVIVVQRLLKTCDGRRKAIREYVVFERELRNELQSSSYEHWAPVLRQRLEGARATLDDKAWDLFRDGQIAKGEFIELAGAKAFNQRSRGLS
jgi:defect-in-organelle-trafficking protein DotB